jgi:hypothetical protein
MVDLGPVAFWEGYEAELQTLALYAVGVTLYALLVGLFYRTLSKRNLVKAVRRGHGGDEPTKKGLGFLGFMFAFPLVSFGMFLVLSVGLFFLAKGQVGVPEAARVRDLLLLSMSLVAGVRVAAYISEPSAEDLAKLVPLGLLGVLLVDPGYFQVSTPFERLAMLPGLGHLMLRYFLALLVLEVVLRLGWTVSGRARKEREKEAKAMAAAQAAQHAGATPARPAKPDSPFERV